MQDLSHLAANSVTATSQAAGNMVSSNDQAMTAPGSRPVDPLPDRTKQGEPDLDIGPAQPVGTARGRGPVPYNPTPATWKTVS